MNKLLIFFAAMLLTCNLVNAQTEKGTQTLGADLTLATNHSNSASLSGESSSYTNFTIGPSYSYFVANNWDVAVNADYGSSVNNYTYNDPSDLFGPSKNSSKAYSATVSIRRYFMYQNKIGLRVGLYTGLTHNTDNFIYPQSELANNSINTTNYIQAGINLSLVYYPVRDFGVSLLLGNLQYDHFKEKSSQQGNSSGSDFNLGFKTDDLGLSLFYVFGGKG